MNVPVSSRSTARCRRTRVAPAIARRTLTALLVAVTVAGCTKSADTVVVGGKNFTEQRILGELVAQAAERRGLVADRRFDLGGTFVCDNALRSGQIDVYVEYTGTALGAILKDAGDGRADAAAVLAKVRQAYEPAGLAWTAPLGFDNTFALVVRADAAAKTISDAVPLATGWKAAFGYEFQQRADGYPALERTYGLRFASIRTMDLGLLYRALVDRAADVVVGSATDAAIRRFSLRVLDDDRHAFPPYEAVPVVRRETLDRHPELAAALDALAGKIDLGTMRSLNEQVEEQRRSPAEVVGELLDRIDRR